MRVAVDHHGALDEFVGALQEVVAGDDAGVVDQYVHLSHLSAHLLGRGIHALSLSHVAHVGVDLRLERGDLLNPSDGSCGVGGKKRGYRGSMKKFGLVIGTNKCELLSEIRCI